MVVKDTGAEFENPPAGMWPGFIVNWFGLGPQPGFEGKIVNQVVGLFELIVLDEAGNEIRMTKGQYVGKRFLMSKTYTLSLNEASNLSIDLTNFRGKEFEAHEREGGFELDVTKGAPAVFNVVNYTKRDGKPGVKVSSINPAIRGGPRFVMETPANYVPAWVEKKRTEGASSVAQQGQGAPHDEIPF